MAINWDDHSGRFRDDDTGRFVSREEGLEDTFAATDYYESGAQWEEAGLDDAFPWEVVDEFDLYEAWDDLLFDMDEDILDETDEDIYE